MKHANFFLLTHKVGNNYFRSTFANCPATAVQADSLKNEMPGPYASEIFGCNAFSRAFFSLRFRLALRNVRAALRTKKNLRNETANFRCRNFDPIAIENLNKSIGPCDSRYFLFTRHPASFFKSATNYHLRGCEKWAITNKYSYLGGLTLTQALRREPDYDQRLIISMKHFELRWGLLSRMVRNYKYLTSINAKLTVVKTEDLFASKSRVFWENLANELSVGDFECTTDFLQLNSPAFLEKLPGHATGAFQESPFEGYGSIAKDFYDNHFVETQNFFYGN